MSLGRDILALVVLLAVAMTLAHEKDAKEVNDTVTGTQKYCGKNLVYVLTLVCDGIYNQLTPRTVQPTTPTTSTSMFRPKRSVLTIFQRSNTRRRRGAYDECCRKGCSLDEMVGYCGSSSPFSGGPE